jgi:hypothetical protein
MKSQTCTSKQRGVGSTWDRSISRAKSQEGNLQVEPRAQACT